MMKPKPAEELLAVEEVVPEVETPTATKPVSKRTHAMLELLNSERAYASDLALIRDVHIPLALGESFVLSFALPHEGRGVGGMPAVSDFGRTGTAYYCGYPLGD